MEKVRRDPASLSQLVKDFDLEVVYKGLDYDTRMITIPDVNRPALQLVGFYDYFEPKRLQILGKAEFTFLKAMPLEQRRKVFEDLLRCEIPALIVARNMEIFPELMEIARKHGRTLLRTEKTTVELTSHIIDSLNRALAPEIIRHYIEIRGIGIIDVQQLFGMGAVQFDSDIEIVIHLEPWQDGKFYDRLGLEGDTYTILGVQLPYVTIPVRPGRNLAGIVEIAAMKNRQMRYGYNSARDFMTQFDKKMDELARQAKEKQ